ncbi:hypothetical protein N657DRAFT_650716 [Parathielavia appendiculata]|uniref:DUF7735 domain-containing protein n=1 Tax=Parathielavia appendiculata TaxID=2587402 RepID=A0AAN6TRQ7_9PEZI|nr:hypothetical protein N657DRAFT_650716 [Parathielavia appendiculata]
MHFNILATRLAALTAITVSGVSTRFLPDSPPVTLQHDSLAKRQATTTLQPSRTQSTLSPDPWQCITENITQYFVNLPTPTGNVLSAIGSYGEEVVKECRATATGHDYVLCTVSNPQDWCGFTTAAPPDILSSYSTYVSEVVSYWTSKSSTISILSTSCPVTWRNIYPHEREWLKIATAHANCYLEAYPQTQSDTTAPTATTGEASTSTTATARTTITTTTSEASVSRRGHTLEALALMSTGLVALANVA